MKVITFHPRTELESEGFNIGDICTVEATDFSELPYKISEAGAFSWAYPEEVEVYKKKSDLTPEEIIHDIPF